MSRIKLALDVVNDLRALAESLETLVQAMGTNEPTIEANEPVAATNEPVEAAKETKKKAAEKETKEEQPTLEELRAVMAEKNRDGHREAVKAIIHKYGANNLSAMDPKYYAQAMKEVGELK